MVKMRELAHEDLGRLVEEDTARQAGLRLAARLAQGPGRGCMSDAGGASGTLQRRTAGPRWLELLRRQSTGSTPGLPASGAARIVFVTVAILYEVVARGWFGHATIWANETTVYLSAVAYLLGGGYALLHAATCASISSTGCCRRAPSALPDVFTLRLLLAYVAALDLGRRVRWPGTPSCNREGTGTPWNPPIWPVKMAIPIAGLLLLLQGIVNLLRDLGGCRKQRRPHEHRAPQHPVRRRLRRHPAGRRAARLRDRRGGRHVRGTRCSACRG